MGIENAIASLEVFKGARSIKQKARATVELSLISEAAEQIAEQYKASLMEAKVYELFAEYERKAEYVPPKSSSYIDAARLVKKLIADGRVAELVKIVSITEKDLKTLDDGEALAEKYRMTGESTKAGLKVSKMTKAEIKASNPDAVPPKKAKKK